MPTLTTQEIERLDALFAKATPGEWVYDGIRVDAVQFRKPITLSDGKPFMEGLIALPYSCGDDLNVHANGELIAALHNAWPRIRESLATPDGTLLGSWVVRRAASGRICVDHKDGSAFAASEDDQSIASVILYRFARDIARDLNALQSAQPSAERVTVPKERGRGWWVPCSPELLMMCPDACSRLPRRDGDGYSHDHFIADPAAPSPQEPTK